MAITFKDVARLAGVSTQTVSRVTNGAQNVAEKTRQRVNEAIDALDYVPNKGAQMLSRAKSRVIGIISLDISLHGVALITNGIRNQAHKMNYATAFSMVGDHTLDEFRYAIKDLIAQQIDAIIINAPVKQKMAENLVLQYSQLTFIFIDVPKDTMANSVSCDHQAGAALGITHLIEQGRKRFICICGPNASSGSQLRYQEWLIHIHRHGLVEVAHFEGNWQAQSGYELMKQALSQNASFDAVLVANDQMALGVLCALEEAQIKVPRQVSVIGFDDIQDAQFFSPALTTIKQDFDELGRQAVKLLLTKIEDNSKPVNIMLPVKLVVRRSSENDLNSSYGKKEALENLAKIRTLSP